jgi:hypothetical protein
LQDPETGDETKKKKEYGSLNNKDPEDEEKDALTAADAVKEGETAKKKTTTTKTNMVEKDPALALKPHRPHHNPCLWLFHLLEGIAVVASCCLLTTQILPLLFIPFHDIANQIGVLNMALRIYIALFCILFALTELSVPIIRNSPLLTTYLSRGFLYSFVGLICVEEAYSERVTDIIKHSREIHVGWAAIFMEVSSWCMLATGYVTSRATTTFGTLNSETQKLMGFSSPCDFVFPFFGYQKYNQCRVHATGNILYATTTR